ncbi:hypothetical protein HK101_010184 [Irineochytrium annulatum]|nr:hypothetical protein HK101_010184 [Irineochytrium annulatum]
MDDDQPPSSPAGTGGSGPRDPLTADQRAEIKRKLLERQRQQLPEHQQQHTAAPPPTIPASAAASRPGSTAEDAPPSSIANATPVIAPIPASAAPSTPSLVVPPTSAAVPAAADRSSLVASASSFLTSEAARKAPRERVEAFLRDQKGLTDAEIQTALARSGWEWDAAGTLRPAQAATSAAPLVQGFNQAGQGMAIQQPAQYPMQQQQGLPGEQMQRPYQPIDPRMMMVQPGQIGPVAPPKPPMTPREMFKNALLVMLLTGAGAWGAVQLIKRLFWRSYIRFRAALAANVTKNKTRLIGLANSVVSFCEFVSGGRATRKPIEGRKNKKEEAVDEAQDGFIEVMEDDGDAEPGVSSTSVVKTSLKRKVEDISTTVEGKMTDLLGSMNGYLSKFNPAETSNPLTSLSKSLSDLNSLAADTPFSSYPLFSMYGGGNLDDYASPDDEATRKGPPAWFVALNDVKADIRSVKGFLLNRRNFPSVASVRAGIASGQGLGQGGAAMQAEQEGQGQGQTQAGSGGGMTGAAEDDMIIS